MSYLLPHLRSGWHVDQAILSEEDRVVVVRFGNTTSEECMVQDEVLVKVAKKVQRFAVIYLVDIKEVSDFNAMYELYDNMAIMMFFRNKLIMVDYGTGNNNKLTHVVRESQEIIDVIEMVYRGARKGKGLVVSPYDYSTKLKY